MTRGMERAALCAECHSREANSTHRGLCWSCYQKARRAGKFRKGLAVTGIIGRCRNCGRQKIIAAGSLCWCCYNNKRRTGEVLDLRLSSRLDKQVPAAPIPEAWREGLCSGCPISSRNDWKGAELCARRGCIRTPGTQIRVLHKSKISVD